MKAIDFEAGRRRLLEERQSGDEEVEDGSAPSNSPQHLETAQEHLARIDRALEQLIAGVRSRPCQGCFQEPHD